MAFVVWLSPVLDLGDLYAVLSTWCLEWEVCGSYSPTPISWIVLRSPALPARTGLRLHSLFTAPKFSVVTHRAFVNRPSRQSLATALMLRPTAPVAYLTSCVIRLRKCVCVLVPRTSACLPKAAFRGARTRRLLSSLTVCYHLAGRGGPHPAAVWKGWQRRLRDGLQVRRQARSNKIGSGLVKNEWTFSEDRKRYKTRTNRCKSWPG